MVMGWEIVKGKFRDYDVYSLYLTADSASVTLGLYTTYSVFYIVYC